jgi:fluoroquinolone transport system ATP-binding protein
MQPVFEVKNLTYRYQRKASPVVQNLNLTIQKGQIFGLLGPSGAGKSTTQKILIKLLQGYGGEVLYLGKPLNEYHQDFYEHVGVGFEMPVHFNKLTGLENIRYFAALYKKHIDYQALMIRLGLGDALNQPVGEYSKGMKIRLNFVKALLHNPNVLFLDEPTNGLDPHNARIVKDIILEQKQLGKTILITTHLMGDVEELCDEVAFIAKGRLIETSSPKTLKIKYGKRELKIEYLVDGELKSALLSLDNLANQSTFMTILKQYPIVTIHSQETSLDKIFIALTGQTHG